MHIKFKLLLLSVLFYSSCTNHDQTSVDEIKLSSCNIKLGEDVFLKYPYRIRIIEDSMLLVWDLHAKENFFHIYSLKGSATKYLYSFGKVGKGPEELIACGGVEIIDTCLSVIEVNRAILYTYTIDNLKKGIGKPNRIVELPKEYVPIVRFTDMGSKGKVILDSKGEHRFFLLNNEGEKLGNFYTIPNKENKELSKVILQQLWTSCCNYNQNNNILVLGTILGDVLEIYNLKNNTVKIIVGKQGEPAVLREESRMSLLQANGYNDIFVGDSAIYALYSDITHKEVRRAQEKGELTPNGGNFIYVFSLDGKMKKKLVLDQYINGFSIDFARNIIYGVTSNTDAQLCLFNLPMDIPIKSDYPHNSGRMN